MGTEEGFRGYGPEQGYEFLREAIAKQDYQIRGCNIDADEIFISDGSKCDVGNIQEIFALNNKVAICDPVYPVYVDSNVMAGRTGAFNPVTGGFDRLIYMPCLKDNGFIPELLSGDCHFVRRSDLRAAQSCAEKEKSRLKKVKDRVILLKID